MADTFDEDEVAELLREMAADDPRAAWVNAHVDQAIEPCDAEDTIAVLEQVIEHCKKRISEVDADHDV